MRVPQLVLAALLLLPPACGAFLGGGHAAAGVRDARRRAVDGAVRLPAVQCGARIRIVSVGKSSRDEPWVITAIGEYTKRLRSTIELELVWVKDDTALQAQLSRAEEPCIILDERGSVATSVELGERLFAGLEEGGNRLSFFIGGADGLPAPLKADRSKLLSLSRLTFPHQVARLLLVEQIYRAAEIRKGSGYHKD